MDDKLDKIILASISSGMGALMLRNKIRALDEIDISDIVDKVSDKIGEFGKAAGTIGKKLINKAQDLPTANISKAATKTGKAISSLINKNSIKSSLNKANETLQNL